MHEAPSSRRSFCVRLSTSRDEKADEGVTMVRGLLRALREVWLIVSAAVFAAAISAIASGCSHGGGGGGGGFLATAGSTQQSFSTVAQLGQPRVYHASVLLPNGTSS